MEKEGDVFHQITSLFIRYPKITITLVILIVCGAIGGIIYLAPQFGNAQSKDITSNALNFDVPTGSPQNQGTVEGVHTQAA